MKYIFYSILLLSFASAQAQPKKYILALSKGSRQMIVYDYTTLDSVTAVAVGEDPHEIVTNPAGSRAYISNPSMNAQGHRIDIIDLQKMQPEQPIDTKPFYIPHGMAYVNDKLWFTAQGSKVVVVYDVKNKIVEQVLGTGQNFTHLIHVSGDGNSFYTTNVESGSISIYERKTIPPYMPPTGVLPANAKPRIEWIQTLINAGPGVEGFDVLPNGKELWAVRPDGFIVIIDTEKKKLVKKINTHVQGLHRLKFTPDGKTVCIVSVKTGDLLYYDVVKRKMIQKESIGKGAGIFMDKDSNRMFISCTPDNDIVVIDLLTKKEIKRIAIGRPDSITAVTVNDQ